MESSRLVLNREPKKKKKIPLRLLKGDKRPQIYRSNRADKSLILVKPNRVTTVENTVIYNDNKSNLFFLPLRQFWGLAAIVLIFLLLVFALIRSNHQSLNLSYDVSNLTQSYLSLMEVNRQLKTEFAELSSLERLEALSREKLGLIVPKQEQIVVVD